jgi:hypothetical protein
LLHLNHFVGTGFGPTSDTVAKFAFDQRNDLFARCRWPMRNMPPQFDFANFF